MPVSEPTYERVALEDPDGLWELHHGRLRSKSKGTWDRNQVAVDLSFLLGRQLSRHGFRVRINSGRVRFVHDAYHSTF